MKTLSLLVLILTSISAHSVFFFKNHVKLKDGNILHYHQLEEAIANNTELENFEIDFIKQDLLKSYYNRTLRSVLFNLDGMHSSLATHVLSLKFTEYGETNEEELTPISVICSISLRYGVGYENSTLEVHDCENFHKRADDDFTPVDFRISFEDLALRTKSGQRGAL